MPVTLHSFSSHLLSEVLELACRLQGKEMENKTEVHFEI